MAGISLYLYLAGDYQDQYDDWGQSACLAPPHPKINRVHFRSEMLLLVTA